MKTRLEILREQEREAMEARSEMWLNNTNDLLAIRKAIEEEMCKPTPQPGDKFYIEVEVQEDNFATKTAPAESVLVRANTVASDAKNQYYMLMVSKSKLIPIK